jgi:hypothetical protein
MTKRNQSGPCRCDACGARFSGLVAFDLHRTGDYTNGTRHCLTPEEMFSRGMTRDGAGRWASGKGKYPRMLERVG